MQSRKEAARRKKRSASGSDGKSDASGSREKITAGSRWQSERSARSHFADIGGERMAVKRTRFLGIG